MWTFLLGLALADPAAEAMDAVVLVVTGSSTCSGAVIDAEGRVGTAYHCVAQGGRPWITTRTGEGVQGRVVAVDRLRDLALIEAPELAGSPWVPILDGPAELGTVVSALGHPYGVTAPQGFLEGTLRWSMTRGVVSAVGPQAVQFSAPVNPGNSGGPVVDEQGQLVAVVSRRTGGGEALGFGARSDHLQALTEEEPGPMGPIGGTWGMGPMLSAWDASAGTVAVGGRLDVAVRDRLVLTGIVRWGLGPRWTALRFGSVEFPGPAGRVGLRQRFGRGRFAIRADAWGEVGSFHRVRAGAGDGVTVDLRPSARTLGMAGGTIALGGSGFDFGCSPVGEGCVASVMLAWPGTVGVF